MSRRFTFVRIALGSLLLLAAGLKLYGLSVSAVPRVGWFAQPWVQLATAEWELVLGLWLLSGAHPRASWFAALLTFAVFAAISGYLGWIGVASCGCFGVIQASPWWAFVIDLVAVAMLVLARPLLPSGARLQLSKGVLFLAGSTASLGAVSAVAALVFGSPEAALARLRGEEVSVSPSYLALGEGSTGAVLESSVEVTNWSNADVRIIGATPDCSCLATSNLPVTVPAGESRRIPVRLIIPRTEPGAFSRAIQLWTDNDRQRVLTFRVGCWVE